MRMKVVYCTWLILIWLLTFAVLLPAQSPPDKTLYSVPTGIEGTISISPTHGGPIRPGVPNSRPLANAEFIVTDEKGAQVPFTTDKEGHFRVMLAPGRYQVTSKQKPRIGGCRTFEVDVTAGAITRVDWNCDSGMR